MRYKINTRHFSYVENRVRYFIRHKARKVHKQLINAYCCFVINSNTPEMESSVRTTSKNLRLKGYFKNVG